VLVLVLVLVLVFVLVPVADTDGSALTIPLIRRCLLRLLRGRSDPQKTTATTKTKKDGEEDNPIDSSIERVSKYPVVRVETDRNRCTTWAENTTDDRMGGTAETEGPC